MGVMQWTKAVSRWYGKPRSSVHGPRILERTFLFQRLYNEQTNSMEKLDNLAWHFFHGNEMLKIFLDGKVYLGQRLIVNIKMPGYIWMAKMTDRYLFLETSVLSMIDFQGTFIQGIPISLTTDVWDIVDNHLWYISRNQEVMVMDLQSMQHYNPLHDSSKTFSKLILHAQYTVTIQYTSMGYCRWLSLLDHRYESLYGQRSFYKHHIQSIRKQTILFACVVTV